MSTSIVSLLLISYYGIIFPRYIRGKYSNILLVSVLDNYLLIIIVIATATLGALEIFNLFSYVNIARKLRILISIIYFCVVIVPEASHTFKTLLKH